MAAVTTLVQYLIEVLTLFYQILSEELLEGQHPLNLVVFEQGSEPFL